MPPNKKKTEDEKNNTKTISEAQLKQIEKSTGKTQSEINMEAEPGTPFLKTPTDFTKRRQSIELPDGRVFDSVDRDDLAGIQAKGGILPQGKTQAELAGQAIATDPSKFGFLKPGEQVADQEGISVTGNAVEESGGIGFGNIKKGMPGSIGEALGDLATIGSLGGGSIFTNTYKVGTLRSVNPVKVVQAGTAAKNQASIASVLGKVSYFGAAALALLNIDKIPSGTINRKVDEQQTAVNTLGMITSTIVGDSLGSAGDYRVGLTQLNFIKQEVLKVEQDIKSGMIADATLVFNGKIIDINADMSDILSTIDEGITDIRSFALEQSFPELTPGELQAELRSLEEQGYIQKEEPLDFQRQTSGFGNFS